jgi:hypothetical protein
MKNYQRIVGNMCETCQACEHVPGATYPRTVLKPGNIDLVHDMIFHVSYGFSVTRSVKASD